jgi:hypothetical protein
MLEKIGVCGAGCGRSPTESGLGWKNDAVFAEFVR